MPVTAQDLWPDDITVNALSPAMILNEQAEALAKRTQGLIQPELVGDGLGDINKLHFDLVAPGVNNFRMRMMSLRYKAEEAYPVVVTASPLSDFALEEEMPDAAYWHLSEDDFSCSHFANSPTEFLAFAREVFGSVEARRVILSLIAKSNEAKSTLSRLRKANSNGGSKTNIADPECKPK